ITICYHSRGELTKKKIYCMRHRRQMRNSDPFNLPERRFIELFRLNKYLVRQLINDLHPYLSNPVRSYGIFAKTKIFCALTILCHRQLPKKCRTRFQFWVEPNKHSSFGIFPGTIGAIDGTHVAILKPRLEEHNFINRKGFHSLNVQIICDHKMLIRNINANFGGSTHDSFIWRNSQIQDYLNHLHEQGERNMWLIGDSGYPLQPYLLVPIANAVEESPEHRYNMAHIAARNCIERCIGVLKTRFRCILKERTARYSPDFVAKLVTVCGALHNMCIIQNVPLFDDVNPLFAR
ncbi:hypothetical protein NQ317_015679, partial [Molorchus minor]